MLKILLFSATTNVHPQSQVLLHLKSHTSINILLQNVHDCNYCPCVRQHNFWLDIFYGKQTKFVHKFLYFIKMHFMMSTCLVLWESVNRKWLVKSALKIPQELKCISTCTILSNIWQLKNTGLFTWQNYCMRTNVKSQMRVISRNISWTLLVLRLKTKSVMARAKPRPRQ